MLRIILDLCALADSAVPTRTISTTFSSSLVPGLIINKQNRKTEAAVIGWRMGAPLWNSCAFLLLLKMGPWWTGLHPFFFFSTLSPLAQFVKAQNALQASVVTTGHPRAFFFPQTTWELFCFFPFGKITSWLWKSSISGRSYLSLGSIMLCLVPTVTRTISWVWLLLMFFLGTGLALLALSWFKWW